MYSWVHTTCSRVPKRDAVRAQSDDEDVIDFINIKIYNNKRV